MKIDKENHTHTHTHTYSLDIPIFTKLYEFYKLFNQHLILFPKTKKYTLGQKIDNLTLEIIELVITAGFAREQKLNQVFKRQKTKNSQGQTFQESRS